MDADKLKQIVVAHGSWVRGEKNGSRANLSGANLSRANLYGANLSGANLYGWKIAEKQQDNPLLSLSFAHGYVLQLIRHEAGVGIVCGCRRFETLKNAQLHWKMHEDDQRRTVVLPALEALFLIAKAQRWPVE